MQILGADGEEVQILSTKFSDLHLVTRGMTLLAMTTVLAI